MVIEKGELLEDASQNIPRIINIFNKHFKSETDLVIARADVGKLPDFQSTK